MNNLQKFRLDKGYTQRYFAELCNITERGYRKIESGDVKPSYNVVIALQKYFNLDIDYLLAPVGAGKRLRERYHKED